MSWMFSQYFLNFLWIEAMNQLIIWQVKTSGTSMKFDSIHRNCVPCHFKTLRNKIDFRKLISIHKYTFVKSNEKRLWFILHKFIIVQNQDYFLFSQENEWCKLLILSTGISVFINCFTNSIELACTNLDCLLFRSLYARVCDPEF